MWPCTYLIHSNIIYLQLIMFTAFEICFAWWRLWLLKICSISVSICTHHCFKSWDLRCWWRWSLWRFRFSRLPLLPWFSCKIRRCTPVSWFSCSPLSEWSVPIDSIPQASWDDSIPQARFNVLLKVFWLLSRLNVNNSLFVLKFLTIPLLLVSVSGSSPRNVTAGSNKFVMSNIPGEATRQTQPWMTGDDQSLVVISRSLRNQQTVNRSQMLWE